MAETETYTVTGPDGDEDTLELPAGLVDLMAEQGEEPTRVLTDVLLNVMAQQAHRFAHHSEGDVPEDIKRINDTAEELFEERFGESLADALGHSH